MHAPNLNGSAIPKSPIQTESGARRMRDYILFGDRQGTAMWDGIKRTTSNCSLKRLRIVYLLTCGRL